MHAGRGKAGSTAIQAWLRRSRDVLAAEGFTLVVARPAEGPSLLELGPYEKGHGNSGGVIRLLRDPATKREAAARLVDALRREADAHRRIVISGEAFSQLVERPDPAVFAPLNGLARSHGLSVVYYVRPQHTALEAAWRQWGFRKPGAPSKFIATQAGRLHYLRTMQDVSVSSPDIDLRVRPFHTELLVGGDVVKDFAQHSLGLDPSTVGDGARKNVGLPLVAVNLLARGLAAGLWEPPHDNKPLERLKAAVVEEDSVGDELRRLLAAVERRDHGAERGRRVLQGWAHRMFEAENLQLLESMGWRVEEWIPPIDSERDDLGALDDHWQPRVSAAELRRLCELVDHVTRAAAPTESRTQRGPSLRRKRSSRRSPG
jgi:hypothetical protein